uniref:Uncharacterized protein n=1 Tax=Caenorhabditis tropicalis TaxID=1561998 RepID=A0A1I7TB83_9PELO
MIFPILFIYFIGFSHGQPPDSPVSIIAQTLDNNSNEVGNQAENENSSINVSNGTLEKYQNATEPSFLYVVQLELKSSRIEESFKEIEQRLNKLVEMAFVLAAYKHRKQVPPAEITTDNSGYSTKKTFQEMNKKGEGDVYLGISL